MLSHTAVQCATTWRGRHNRLLPHHAQPHTPAQGHAGPAAPAHNTSTWCCAPGTWATTWADHQHLPGPAHMYTHRRPSTPVSALPPACSGCLTAAQHASQHAPRPGGCLASCCRATAPQANAFHLVLLTAGGALLHHITDAPMPIAKALRLIGSCTSCCRCPCCPACPCSLLRSLL